MRAFFFLVWLFFIRERFIWLFLKSGFEIKNLKEYDADVMNIFAASFFCFVFNIEMFFCLDKL